MDIAAYWLVPRCGFEHAALAPLEYMPNPIILELDLTDMCSRAAAFINYISRYMSKSATNQVHPRDLSLLIPPGASKRTLVADGKPLQTPLTGNLVSPQPRAAR